MLLGDVGLSWQLGFQEPVTPIQEGIIEFHNDLMLVMIFVVSLVTVMLCRIVFNFKEREGLIRSVKGEVHGTVIEIIWTVIPGLVLMVVSIPSFTLLYAVEEVVEASVTLKVVGRQWYWTYEYSDYAEELEFDSYMIGEEELSLGELRLLEVDNRVILPVETHIRLIITGGDVLHSFAVPSFGLKMDACPGRLNEVSLFIKRPGVYYGQCSELCGVNHAFMPICVEGVSLDGYVDWLSELLEE